MINGELEREISSLELKNETLTPPKIIGPISLYNRIPHAKEKERKKLLKQGDEIVATILSEGETCAKELRGEHVQEALREAVKKMFEELDSNQKTSAEKTEPTSEILSYENDPLILAQKIDALKKENAELKKRKGTTQNHTLSPAISENENQIQKLQELKTKILKKEIAEYLNTPYGQEVLQALKDIILDIQEEHALQKLKPYTHDAMVTFVYEFIYEGYLWRNEKRKDKQTSYFLSHLTDAVKAHIQSGFTSLARLLAALKHDSPEDLPYHKQNCDPDSKKSDPKKEWTFCTELYKDKFRDKPTEKHPLPSDEYLKKVIDNAYATILSITNPDDEEEEMMAWSRKEKDARELTKFFEQVIHRYGYPAVIKILEQLQNAKTLRFLAKDRIPEKLDLMLKNFAILAKMLRLDSAYRVFIGAGINYYRPDLREWFYNIQKEKLEQGLELDMKRPEASLLKKILKPHWSTRIKNALCSILNPDYKSPKIEQMLGEYLSESQGNEIQANILATRNKIQAAFHAGRNEIVSIEIIPSALEDYIDDIEALKNPEYYPKTEPDDPLFEIRILVKSPEDILPIDAWIYEVTGGRTYKDKDRDRPAPYPPDCYKGVSFTLPNNIRVRINDVRHENLMKRGVFADRSKSIPEELRDRLIEALKESKIFGTPLLQAIQEKVLRKNIVVMTKDGDRILVPEGATALDLAASLPEETAMKTMIFGKKIRIGRADPQNPLEELENEKKYTIETSETPTWKIGMIPFCITPRYRKILATYLKREAEKRAEEKNRDPKECLREIAEEQTDDYLQELTSLFFTNESDMQDFLILLAMDTLYGCPLDDPVLRDQLAKLKNLLVYQQEIQNYPLLEATFQHDVRTLQENIEKRIQVLKKRPPWKQRELVKKYEQQKEETRIQIGLGKFDLLKTLSKYLNRKPAIGNTHRPITCESEHEDRPGIIAKMTEKIRKKDKGINIQPMTTYQEMSASTATMKLALRFPEKMSSYEILKFYLKLFFDTELVKNIKVDNVETFAFPEYLTNIHQTIQKWQRTQSPADQTSQQ